MSDNQYFASYDLSYLHERLASRTFEGMKWGSEDSATISGTSYHSCEGSHEARAA